MITLPGAVLTAIDSGRFAVRLAARFDLGSGPAGLWNDTWAMTYGGCTFQPLAGNMKFDGITGTSSLSVDTVGITVSNLDPAVQGVIDGQVWHQRPVTIYLVWLDDSGQVLHILPRFSGFLDSIKYADRADGPATLAMSIESNNRELSRSGSRTRSDADQRQVGGATDSFFAHVAAVAVNTNIYWGRSGPHSPD